MKGAGGTEGGLGSFFIGVVMLGAGLWMLFDSIHVSSGYGLISRYYGGSGLITMGPLILGIFFLFFNSKNKIGWILSGVGLLLIITDVISSLQFFMHMKLWQLIVVLVFIFGGLGMTLRSFAETKSDFP
ncbi:MAG: hypothetical protein HGB19_01860 [Chlorobiales bacterium]|nr:hypothetical protein [Chlorobiales bacterium]